MDSRLKCYQLTSTGDKRKNQDATAFKVCDQYGLFIVADGLGGHQWGELASQFFCQGIFNQVPNYQKRLKNSNLNVQNILHEWVNAAISDMEQLFKDTGEIDGSDSHTTCVILYLDETVSVTAHCGDSRIYRLNEKSLLWRTKDHSVLQKLLDEIRISEHEMGLHPNQNRITRTINIKKRHQVEVNIYPPMKKGETFILCTDGFWTFLKEEELMNLAAPESGIDELKKLTKMMNMRANGKGDNLTVQWIRHC